MNILLKKSASLAVLLATLTAHPTLAHDNFPEALKTLRSADTNPSNPVDIQQAWSVVAKGNASQLTSILSAMTDAGPLADNWLRGAVDTIAERELRESGNLPTTALEKFILNNQQSPRARRTAFEWLDQVDSTTRKRLLPKMLNDSSLELRYDAVAQLLNEAAQATGDTLKRKLYQQAFASARAMEQITECIKQLEKLGEPPNLVDYFAYVTQWMIIGPFDNTQGVGFNNVYPPEEELNYDSEYKGKSEKVTWSEHQTEATDLKDVGQVDLNEVLLEEKGVVAYAATTLISPIEQHVDLRYETLNASKLWVNGQPLATNPIYHAGGEFDQYVVPVKLQQGQNTILLKIIQNEQTDSWARPWAFRLRIADQYGAGIVLENDRTK